MGLVYKVKNNLVKYYLLFQPIVGFLYYYLKIGFTTYINHIFIGMFILYSIIILKNEKKNILFFFLCLFSIIFVSTLVQLIDNMNFEISIFVTHLSAYLMLFLLFLLGNKIDFFKLFKNNHRFIYTYLILDLIILIIFKLDILDKNVYPSFESSYLIPSYIYSLIIHNKLMLFFHLILFLLHAKRAVLIFAIIVFLFFIYFNISVKKRILLLFSLPIFFIIISLINVESIINMRYLNIYYAIVNNDLSFISSFEEKFREIIGAISLKNNIFNILFGNGIGWYYYIQNFYDEFVPRNYTHFTIIFIFISNGLFGVTLFVFLHLKIFYEGLFTKNINITFITYVILSYFLISFSVLNLFTNPLYILFLGSFFKQKRLLNE